MSFLHCHNPKCYWEQDDFWSESYNPIKSLQNWIESLLSPKLDEQFTYDAAFLREYGPISTREAIIKEIDKAGKCIRKMKWLKMEDWVKDGRPPCPNCGQPLDVD